MNIVLHNENVIHDNIVSRENKSYRQQIQCMDKIRKNAVKSFIPGVKPKTCPAFLNKRLGLFPIPDKVWNAVLGNADEVVFTDDYKKALYRIETLLPGLLADININNYNDKWHTLLYMEEVQQNISMRSYDMPKVFLDRYQDYLSINIHGLSERRPSLIKGDKVLLKDIWNSDAPHYEGFIHSIVGDTVLMKFSPKFHEVYSGYDVSLEFHFSRTVYRRCHQAVNMAIECLGPDVLFPSRILISNCQVDNTKLNTIEWCNPSLNKGQKTAISNILAGECRPLPYCIFGPPGTGKTITIVETIVQILKHFPESRILVATPSNSASNILTERLIQYRNKFSGSISRIIAFYLLDSDALPDSIKPYCSTIDISKEDSQKNNQQKLENGINLNCQARFIARYRVVIGTCISLGVLGHLGLPKGHFTHIIVDEAGQATEPEIMIPLSFIDKNNGQIILAGDPLQLGPVVLSNYCKEYGLNESYFQRILQRFPYQKDTDAFQDQGFDRRLVSLLTENYRSLEEVLHMPNNIFYDGQLISNLTLTEWVVNLINILSEIFSSTEKRGGIFIYGIKGQNARAIDSPSWYNPQEAAMVLFFVCKLYKKKVTPDQIGIITPYIAQIKYLRQIFISIGCPLPKIGTVEEFQGQERPIIVLSTVRSTEALIHYDVKQFLGFVNSPKRINVALTRAQVATVIFCNPYVLSKDSLWKRVIEYAVQNNNYTGCDLPTDINHELI
ncbi:Probable RNA helicase armi [Eumeta japonica]|uniref:RNA helicase n=1 Tax=Eumeta variegata TaxID=151549 RepID=A0A4C1VMT4_EUMVA|nr:Probable RNA helicase armi [Eumeta japonica]